MLSKRNIEFSQTRILRVRKKKNEITIIKKSKIKYYTKT